MNSGGIKGGRGLVLACAAAAALAVGVGALGYLGIGPLGLDRSSEGALERRAQVYWDMRIAGDSLGAYEFMSEAYRRRVTPQQFSLEGGRVVRTGAKVKAVQIDDQGGLVDLELRYRFANANFAEIEHRGDARDRWVLENGTWYRWPPGL